MTILKYLFIVTGSFLFMYNCLQIDTSLIKGREYRNEPSTSHLKYYYRSENILGASIGFALGITGIFMRKKDVTG